MPRPKEEETSWASVAVLAAAGLGIALLVWRSYVNDAPRVQAYRAPAAAVPAAAPRVDAPQSLAALAESHRSARRFAEAAAVYRRMLALDPKDASLHNELGMALHYTGKGEAAVAALERATALDPKLQRAWLSLGFVNKSLGREKAARAALAKAFALDPSSPVGVEAASMLGR